MESNITQTINDIFNAAGSAFTVLLLFIGVLCVLELRNLRKDWESEVDGQNKK